MVPIGSQGKCKISGSGDLCIFTTNGDLHYFGNEMLTIGLIFIQKQFELVNTIFLSFPISNQKAQCLQVRVQAIPQPKKNMKSEPYMIRMVKRFM